MASFLGSTRDDAWLLPTAQRNQTLPITLRSAVRLYLPLTLRTAQMCTLSALSTTCISPFRTHFTLHACMHTILSSPTAIPSIHPAITSNHKQTNGPTEKIDLLLTPLFPDRSVPNALTVPEGRCMPASARAVRQQAEPWSGGRNQIFESPILPPFSWSPGRPWAPRAWLRLLGGRL